MAELSFKFEFPREWTEGMAVALMVLNVDKAEDMAVVVVTVVKVMAVIPLEEEWSLEMSMGEGGGMGERDVGELLSGVSRAGLLWEEGRLTLPLRN